MKQSSTVSAERYFVGAVVVSIATALIASRFAFFSFGGVVQMAAVLITADVVVYVLAKLGAFGG